MTDYGVVVVGAGISGLLSALALSKEGKRVLVLEKENFLGGVCRSYEVEGYPGYWVDTGVHALTRLERGPLRELMNRYFDPAVLPRFVPFGTYYVRIGGRTKPFPWSVKDWLMFDLLPTKDRLLLMKSLFNVLYLSSVGKDLSAVPISAILPAKLSAKGRRFLDWLSYFMLGTSAENAPVSRFIDNKNHKPNSIPYIGKIYNLLISEGARDQGYPEGGLQSLLGSLLNSFPKNRVEVKTGEEVVKINSRESKGAEGVVTKKGGYSCEVVVYSGPASSLPDLVEIEGGELPGEYVENLRSIRAVNSLTIWLGLTRKIFKNRGSEMWVDSDPYAWVVPTSNYDPKLAPHGRQLVGFTFSLPESEGYKANAKANAKANVKANAERESRRERRKAFDAILKTVPGIERAVEMVHCQELVPEKACWAINAGFGDVRTPVKNLYTVGTDAEKRSAGISRAAYSVLRFLEVLRADKIL